ncbi:MAG: PilZ domain-containing protein [Planctomycetota bacterium]|jgi:c-di-GMP-binding flagellar brake protein YcgR
MPALTSVSREIQRAIDIVEGHMKRVEPFYERRREHRRQKVNKHLHVFPSGYRDFPPTDAWSFEISRGGMGFVCESQIELGSVVLCLEPNDDQPIWMRATVKHCKEVMDGVHACGVQFQGHAEALR